MDNETFTRTVLDRASTSFDWPIKNVSIDEVVSSTNLHVIDAASMCDFAKRKLYYSDNYHNPNGINIDLLHGYLGMVSELGELVRTLSGEEAFTEDDEVGYNANRTNLIEECGDLLWYIALFLSAINSSISEAMQINDAKLTARYGPAFSSSRALRRDLNRETRAMEGKSDE